MTTRVIRGGAWLGVVLGVIACQALAQGPADLPKVPILENTTYVLLKLDLNKVDGDAMVKWIVDAADKAISDPTDKQQTAQMLRNQFQTLVTAQQTMLKAGAPVVYFAFNEFPINNGPLIYAPVAKGGDPEAVRMLMFSGPTGKQKGPDIAKAQPTQNVTVAMPDGVFMGRAENYQRISQPHASAPYLLFALSQAPAAPVQIVAAPTEGLSLMLETMSPQIPPPVDLPMTTLTRGISSAVLTMQAPPDALTHLAVQTSDAATAAQLKAVADKLLAMLNSPQAQQQMPPGMDLKAMLEALSPKVTENQLTIDLASDQSSAIPLAFILPQMAKARQSAMMTQSASQLRQLLVATIKYASQNQGKLPDSLDQLGPQMAGLSNPRIPPGKPGYVYAVKPGTNQSQMKSNQILIYENTAALPTNTTIVNVGYVDGHVDAMPLGALMQRLAAQGADKPALPGR